MRVAFLIADFDEIIDGNYLRFANELTRRGISLFVCLTDTLSLSASEVTVAGWQLDSPLQTGQAKPPMQQHPMASFDVAWLFSLGMRQSFLDKYQLLFSLGDKVRFVNSLDAIMHLKSKYFITGIPEVVQHPETHAGTDPEALLRLVNESNATWVAKPPAGSLGRDVFLLKPGDSNNRAILDHLCGPARDQYTLLQAFVPEIDGGEKRVLFAAGEVVGQYRRTAVNDHRTNLLQGATGEICSLTGEEMIACTRIGTFLASFGANFVGMDLVYPWVIEFNVINPGGMLTIEELSGVDLTHNIIDRLAIT
jgi:glutathione synthase